MNVETLIMQRMYMGYRWHALTSGYSLESSEPNKLILKRHKDITRSSSDSLLLNLYLKQLHIYIENTYSELKKYFDITFGEVSSSQNYPEIVFTLKPEYKHQQEEIAGYLRIQGIL